MCDLIMTPGKLDTRIYIYKGDGLKYVEQVWVDVKKDEDCELLYCVFHRVHNELKFPRPLTHEITVHLHLQIQEFRVHRWRRVCVRNIQSKAPTLNALLFFRRFPSMILFLSSSDLNELSRKSNISKRMPLSLLNTAESILIECYLSPGLYTVQPAR